MKVLRKIISRFFNTFTAAIFAERGHYREAAAVMDKLDKLDQEEKRHTRLIVIGKNGAFSQKIIDYALNMASRMQYEIIAVSTAPLLACHTLSIMTQHKDKMCAEFEEHAKESVKIFKQKAF